MLSFAPPLRWSRSQLHTRLGCCGRRHRSNGQRRAVFECIAGDDGERQDWRAFRARLVHSETQAKGGTGASNRESEDTQTWAHHVPFIERGSLLIANPQHFRGEHACSFFANTVVLVVHHDHVDGGTVGLIVNRPMDGGASRSCTRAPLFLGGPVGLDAVTALHRDAHFGRVVAGAVRTAAFAETMRRLEGGELRADACRLFCGYSGWAPRQLQHEVDVGVWLPCSASDALLMGFSDAAAPTLGARLLRLMGGRFADIAARQPGDDKLL